MIYSDGMDGHELGLFPLGAVLVPGELMPLHIFEPRYKDLIADCLEHEHPFVLLYADDDGAREIGCTAAVTEVLERFDDGRMNIVIVGEEVVRVVGLARDRSYLSGRVTPAEDDREGAEAAGARAVELYNQIAAVTGVEADAAIAAGAGPLSYAIAARVELPADEKQRMLEHRTERGRLELIMEILERGLERLAAASAIQQVAQTNGKSSLHR
jgi:Lon protease-like protein